MKKYNFDQHLDRKDTGSIKFSPISQGKDKDILSYWIADMDFETADEIKQAIIKRAEHGIYGYTEPKDDYWSSVGAWMMKKHGFLLKQEWCICTPGIVFALSACIRGLTKEGDAVIIQRPVYYPFTNMIIQNHRKVINSPLKEVYDEKGMLSYEMDFEDFEKKVIAYQVKLFILCNPHNPVGRVWTKKELRKIGEICVTHGVICVSDEIHSDFVRKGHRHNMLAGISKEIANSTITCSSPSKTFNMAGLQISNIIISDSKIREKVHTAILQTGYEEVNIFGLEACCAAYNFGEAWLDELKEYLEKNRNYAVQFIKEKIPKLIPVEMEGTYLLWLDFRGFGLKQEELSRKISEEANIWLDCGSIFGAEGCGFQRMNLATSREYLKKGLMALERVFYTEDSI